MASGWRNGWIYWIKCITILGHNNIIGWRVRQAVRFHLDSFHGLLHCVKDRQVKVHGAPFACSHSSHLKGFSVKKLTILCKRRLIFTIFVPYSMACLEWKVPCFPVKPWQTWLGLCNLFYNLEQSMNNDSLLFSFLPCTCSGKHDFYKMVVAFWTEWWRCRKIFTWQMTLLSLVSNMFGRVCRRNGITKYLGNGKGWQYFDPFTRKILKSTI